MPSRAVITGVGVISALGDHAADLHAALCRGESSAQPVSRINDRDLPEPGTAAPVAGFLPSVYLGERNFRPLDRAGQLAACAAHLALQSGGWSEELREKVEVDLVVGTTFCSAHTITRFDRNTQISGPKYAKPLDFANTVINAAAGQAAIWHNLRGANTTVAAGKVSGLRALKHAQIQIDHGSTKVALVGGVEELCFETYCGFLSSGQLCQSGHGTIPLPFDREREGFILGEGAAFAVLENPDSARDRGAEILGELLGHGSSYDVSRGRDERNAVDRCAGAIRSALEAAGISAADVDAISCSANASRSEDRFEALALAGVFGERLATIPVTAIGGALGETLGASGLLQAVVFLEAAREGKLPGVPGIREHFDDTLPPLLIDDQPIAGQFKTGLILSLGYDGSSAATIIRAPETSRR